MKRGYPLFFVIILCGFFLRVANGAPSHNLDQIIVIINNTVITESELDEAINKIKKQLTAAHTTLPNADVLRKQVLEQLINRKLQLDLAAQYGIHVDEQDVDKAIQTIATNNHLSVATLYAEVTKQGLTRTEYRSEIHDEYLIHKVQQQSIGGKIRISDEEVDDFMRSATWLAFNGKEYHLEDILITLPESPTADQIGAAKKRAENIILKLHQGLPFRQAAVAESGSNQPLQQAGDLGWRKLPEIPTAFSSQLIQSKENDIFGPIQTSNGFHILHVAGVRNATLQGSPQEQRKKVQELLYERKYEEALQSWITRVHSEAFINMHPEEG